MEKEYSFLSDERAIAEIRKHKLAESQKANREIGFATAALDWIKRFGEDWKRNHLKENKNCTASFERKEFRHHKVNLEIEGDKEVSSITNFTEPAVESL